MIVKHILAQDGVEIEACSSMRRTALHIAAEFDHVDIVRLLLAQGADLNSRDVDGSTALHLASQQGSRNALELLMKEANIDLFSKNKFG